MHFLANENFPFPSTKILRDAGFQVKSIAEEFPGISDNEVIDIAVANKSIILTFDRDYGELLVRYSVTNPPAVVYFRVKGKSPQFAGNLLLKIIQSKDITLENHFTVIEPGNIRQRKY